HNPVGRVFTYEELHKMGEICLRNNVKLVVDEIHADIVFKPHKHITFTNLPKEIRDQSVVLISPSKTFNLAGFQTSAAIIPNQEMLEAYRHQAEINRTGSINCMGEVAMCAAYDQCAYYVDELMEYLAANKSFAEETVRDRFPSLKLIDLEGTYLLWVDFRKADIPLSDLDRFLIEEAKIAVDYGHWFGEEGLGFIRINIACPKHLLAEAFDRLETAMAKYTD
ncbi:MAG: aminotransferase class I/II-fold pyridoxal phosphate-dependent enzyme, partial [Erysipelotrichaceae bacterium]